MYTLLALIHPFLLCHCRFFRLYRAIWHQHATAAHPKGYPLMRRPQPMRLAQSW